MLLWVFLKLKGSFMKIFEASAEGQVVRVGGRVVPDCPILGEGLGSSSGYLVMAEEKLVYLPKTTPDLKALLEILKVTLGIIATEIFPENLGGKITADSFGQNIVAQQTQIEQLMKVLK